MKALAVNTLEEVSRRFPSSAARMEAETREIGRRCQAMEPSGYEATAERTPRKNTPTKILGGTLCSINRKQKDKYG